ncbi:MAG: HRDC domain-containing protein [Sporichthyaceae bacterium]
MSEAAQVPEGRALTPLLEPAGGVPPVVADITTLTKVAGEFAAGHGPVAVDAERASGYRYGQRAYLIQLRREGAGSVLIDPIAVPDLSPIIEAISDVEWVLHAASQDIPCLAELGLRATKIFDTELAGRLLDYPRVGLGSIVAEVLGLALEKGHSAADWSVRPLPDPWLKYAALDVEVLIDLRDALEAELAEAGKLEWAHEEFEAIVAAPLATPRVDPWRRASGLHRVRRPRQLAIVRSMWETRDRMARARDLAPGRVLPDTAIVEAALAGPATLAALAELATFGGRATRRALPQWFAAIEEARALPDSELPPAHVVPTGPPPARSWPDRDPEAAARLSAMRAAVNEIALKHRLPTENLIAPDTVRRIAWTPPADTSAEGIAAAAAAYGARNWQVDLTAGAMAQALADAAAGRAVPEAVPEEAAPED